MRNLVLIFVLFTLCLMALLSGCASWTPREKQTAAIVASVIIAAVIISENDGDTTVINAPPCHTHEKHHRCD